MNTDILLGKTTEHLVPLEGTKFLVHHQMAADFRRLQRSAAEAGFDLQLASAFRDFDRQLRIWNAKAKGERALIDDLGNKLEFSLLSSRQIMFAILRWSAIPGCSRHHWGTDIDVFDSRTQKPEEVKLVPAECEGTGPAANLHEWLDSVIGQDKSYGFYRPYRTDQGGIAPERWHLSYHPVSSKLMSYYTSNLFKKNISESDILLKEELLQNADELFQRFFLNIDPP